MEFENLEQLKELFASGQFTFPEEMTVAGIKYKSNVASNYSVKTMIEKNYKAMWIYFTSYKEEAKKAGLDHAIIFLWGFPPNSNKMVPWDVRATSKARVAGPIKEDSGNSVNIPKERIVGDVVDLQITSIPGTKTIRAKIDSGADISSLHADSWEINNEQVTFVSPELSENKITMHVIEKQAIKISNGDTEYRPVIELNIKINDIQLSNCMFNLNDRGSMKYSVLIGQNILEAGKFMIDPTIDDPSDSNITMENYEIDWEALQEEFKDEIIEDISTVNENVFMEEIINFIKDGIKK